MGEVFQKINLLIFFAALRETGSMVKTLSSVLLVLRLIVIHEVFFSLA